MPQHEWCPRSSGDQPAAAGIWVDGPAGNERAPTDKLAPRPKTPSTTAESKSTSSRPRKK